MKVRRLAAVSLVAVVGFFLFIGIVSAYVVSPSSPNGWGFLTETGTGTGSFVDGPVTPPLGSGSARLTTTGNGSGQVIATSAFQGTKFSAMTKLEYSTYQASRTGPAPAIALQFTADDNLDDADNGFKGRLVYEPYRTETVKDAQWQTWNPMNGKWFGTGVAGPTRPFAQLCPQSAPCTWLQVKAYWPNGGIHATDPGAIILKAGSGWGAYFSGNVDAFTIGVNGVDTTADFEQNGANVLVSSPATPQGWIQQASGTASTDYVTGPGAPPLGAGSGELVVGSNGNSAAQFRQPTYNGTLLSNLTALQYSTYVSAPGSGGQAAYIILNIDLDNNGSTDDQLFFEPVYQNGTYSGAPVPNQCGADLNCVDLNTWQTWDALNGGWWSLNAATFGPPLTTLANYIAANPGAKIANTATGGVRIVAGFGAGAWDNFVGNVDAFTIGVGANVTTYDFESDGDGDGFDDNADNCPSVSNPDQANNDGDALGDACDSDDDNDGVADGADNCQFTANAGQEDLDSDGIGDACDADVDGDGVLDGIDNCPTTPNAGQEDLDSDGQGDACDADDDGDGVLDANDNCPTTSNSDQANNDGDAQGDACDADDDNDGVNDGPDNCDFVANPSQTDTDNDGQGNACDADDDGDGVADTADACPLTPGSAPSGCPVPANSGACKNGGWMTLTRADGSPFKNQGDCVQYFNTGK